MVKDPKRVVIIGGGFAGLRVAMGLRKAPVEIVLIDKHNYHLFQPLLYQVATAGLSPGDIASPIRGVLSKQRNVRVVMGKATRIDREERAVYLRDERIDYDYVIVATGMRNNYFGNDAWELHAPGLKSLEEAVDIRRNMLLSFEAAEYTDDVERMRELMTFVVIGGGPTGVEMAGAISEIACEVMQHDFRNIDAQHTRIVLIEGQDRLLSAFSPESSERTLVALRRRGIEVVLNTFVKEINEEGVQAGDEFIRTQNIVWGAGLRAQPIIDTLDTEQDRAGRAIVEPELHIKGDERVFVLGDTAHVATEDGSLPGLAPVAIQQGDLTAKNILRHMRDEPMQPFQYLDKGIMATIGRSDAVAEAGSLKLGGFIAWLAWLFIHLIFLVGFRNKIAVLINWAYAYMAFRRSTRLIINPDETSLGRAILEHGPERLEGTSPVFDEALLRVSAQHAAVPRADAPQTHTDAVDVDEDVDEEGVAPEEVETPPARRKTTRRRKKRPAADKTSAEDMADAKAPDSGEEKTDEADADDVTTDADESGDEEDTDADEATPPRPRGNPRRKRRKKPAAAQPDA